MAEVRENLVGFALSGKTQEALESLEIEQRKFLKILCLVKNKLESLQQDIKS